MELFHLTVHIQKDTLKIQKLIENIGFIMFFIMLLVFREFLMQMETLQEF